LIELALGLALITVLWSRFRSRSVLVLAVVAYAVPYVWFVLLGGHADHMTEAAHAFLQRITT
jgi:hypothetical protein